MNECHCSCHTDDNIMHVINCCTQCPQCYRNVLDIYYHMVDKHDIIVGMTLDEARQAGYNVRATSIDNIGQTIEADYSSRRINVEIENGVISKILGWG